MIDDIYGVTQRTCQNCDWFREVGRINGYDQGRCTRNAPGPNGFFMVRQKSSCGEFAPSERYMTPEGFELERVRRRMEYAELKWDQVCACLEVTEWARQIWKAER